MANQAKKKDNKNLIIGICVAVVAVVAIVLAIVFLAKGNNAISDDYFKSDDTKYVLTVDTETMDIDVEDEEYVPVRTHIVYTYSGDEITGMKTYVEYADAATAQKAFDEMKAAGESDVERAEVNGKYIVVTNEESEYEDMTVSDVKQQIELMEMFKNMNSDDDSEEDTDEIIEFDDEAE